MKTNNSKISAKEACTLAHKIRRETGCSLAEAFKAAYSRNIPTKTSWTMDDLNKIFSDKVAELLRKGYIIDLAHMSGHQGEIGKVRFKKDGHYFQLIMEEHNEFTRWYGEQIIIRFGQYTDKDNIFNTLWTDRFDTQWSMIVVKITDNYFVTPELAAEFCDKRQQRCNNNPSTILTEVDSKYHKAVLSYIRKQKGFKRTKASDIVKVTRLSTYNDFENRYNRRYYRVELSNKQTDNGNNYIMTIKF